jgi:uncharacterized protein YjbI with pentapeptide repeats
MANQQHVAILKQGPQAWNAWRQQNPTVTPDLSKGNLKGANLSGANLSRANLSEADLRGVDLGSAHLPYFIAHTPPLPQELVFDWEYPVADLRNTDLSNSNLSRSDLRNADVSGANLSGVNLTGATADIDS